MYRTCKRVIRSWLQRAAFHAVDNLQDAWGEQLFWPLEILTPSPPLDSCELPIAPSIPVGTESFDPSLSTVTTMNFDIASLPSFSEGSGMNLG